MSIILDKVDYIYGAGTVFEKRALKNINLQIKDGEFIGLIGHTGSGKSTLVQHLNGLIRATSGTVYYNGQDIYDKDFSMRELRSKVGLVFQYPEHQLFEASVIEDVRFGPLNLGLPNLDVDLRSFDALELVGISEDLIDVSPFKLSGGQQRRVAIAGVLAMKPEILILDEPTAGLDPKGRDDILGLISKLRRDNSITVVLVSHSMEDIARYVDRIIVMNEGEIFADSVPKEIFKYYKELEKIGLAAPQVTYIMNGLKEKGCRVSTDPMNIGEAVGEILRCYKGGWTSC